MSIIFGVLLCLCWVAPIPIFSQSSDPHAAIVSDLEWRSIGPFRGGRSCAVAGVPGQPNLFYFGATGGGVWKTTDGGRSWESISDGYFGGSIGCVSVAPSDPNVIYVGGGEKTVRGNVSYGYGAWRSEDAGQTWKHIGLDKSYFISRMRIDPNNPDIVYAAVMGNLFAPSTERGVFKSTDGGKTWRKTLYANDQAGAVDLVIDPTNPRILYASTWYVKRTPYSLDSGGEGSGMWKSTDYGETWTEITKNSGLPGGVWGISGVTVSPRNGNRVWAIIENEKGGVYRSDDGGKTWSKLNDDRALRQRAWYYTRIYADTHDENTVYVVNVSYHKSTDGGRTYKASNAPHGDHHDLWIAPEDPRRMIIADDGGAQITYDGGETWSSYHNQNTAQFYRVTTDNDFPFRIYVAQQDNSTIRIPHRTSGTSIRQEDWEQTAGGESGHIAVNPDNPDIVYGGSYGGLLTRVDHRLKTVRAVNVWPDNPMGYGAEGMKYRFQWNFPIFFSPHSSKKLYTTSNHVHVTTDEGQTWEIISPDLTRNEKEKLGPSGGPITKDNTSVEYYCTIFAAAESPAREGVIWAGSDDGLMHVTTDGGKNWANVTPSVAPKYLMINSVDPHPTDPATCYIAGTQYKLGDFQPYLYKTNDYGKTWKKITNGIDPAHFTRVLRMDPNKPGLLYAGTETQMYISYNDGDMWYPFQLNMPIVPITDMTIKDDNLIVVTQGRGIYIMDDLTVIHQAIGKNIRESTLFVPKDSYRFGNGQNKNNKQEGLNHPSGVVTYFHLADFSEKDTVRLVYKNTDGTEIRNFSNKSADKSTMLQDLKKGLNMYNWNMRTADATRFDGMIMWWGIMNGPKVAPGKYIMELHHNGKVQSQSFNIMGNPKVEQPQADYDRQFSFLKSIVDKVSASHEAIIEIRSIKDQLAKFLPIVKEHDDVTSEIKMVDSTLTFIENELYQTKNRSNQDPLNYPIKLTNKLAHLNSLTQIGDFPPTAAAIKVRDELSAEIDRLLDQYRAVKESKIPAINEMIRSKNVDYINLKKL